MSENPVATARLDSWKEIASYVGRNVRTVIRWEKERGLPVHRVPGGGRQAVFAFPDEIDSWMRSGRLGQTDSVDQLAVQKSRENSAEGTLPPIIPEHGSEAPAQATGETNQRSTSRGRLRAMSLASAGAVLLVLIAFAIYTSRFHAVPILKGMVQLTNDGTFKQGLVTDGRLLYFGEGRDGKIVVSRVSVDGGPISSLHLPFESATPYDITPNGASLLVLARKGIEVEQELWVVPTQGGPPRRVGAIHCHEAVWSPDGMLIAYATRNAIYLTDNLGATSWQLHAFQEIPEDLHWLPNGRGLRFRVRDPNSLTASFWQLGFTLQQRPEVSSIEPLHLSLDTGSIRSSNLNKEGRSFVSATEDSNTASLFSFGTRTSDGVPHLVASHVTSVLASHGDLAVDTPSRRLFTLGNPVDPRNAPGANRLEMIWVDPKSNSFRPFLPGVEAREVDYSRDGRRIAYIRTTDHTLWVAAADGDDAHQLNLPIPDPELELPRWSPDGKWIALMLKQPNKPWRIYVLAVDGTHFAEAGLGEDSQGAPTWSADGRTLLYGNVECQAKGSCAVHTLQLSTRRELMVPGSEGLGTARWSPDGRTIAALSAEKHQVLVFDSKKQEWRVVATDVNGNDLSWSADSKYLYASRPAGDHPEILRISRKDGSIEPIVDLSTFAKWSGNVGAWFTVTPDNCVLFIRTNSAGEIFSFSFSDH